MHIEIQVALNFVISYLYNKLPRRRVNLFGEELEKALKQKFSGHWYPDKPVKGSAFRCLRVGTPIDPVLEIAALESGIDLTDIRDNLPAELSVWIDPGEVSYRIGEKGSVKMLYVEETNDENLDKEVTRSFNPEAQCFKPIESVSSSMSNLTVSPANSSSTSPYGNSPSPSFKSTSPTNAFLPAKSVMPLTFTTATFAQTKFGSTKLKTNSKRSNRMSPTEFSNYIKQRAILQQQQQPQATASIFGPQGQSSPQPPQRPRSLSPNPSPEHQFLFMTSGQQQQQHLRGLFDNGYLGDLFGTANGQQQSKYCSAAGGISTTTAGAVGNSSSVSSASSVGDSAPFLSNAAAAAAAAAAMGINDNSKTLLDGINYNLNTMPYPNQHQHLLVAN